MPSTFPTSLQAQQPASFYWGRANAPGWEVPLQTWPPSHLQPSPRTGSGHLILVPASCSGFVLSKHKERDHPRICGSVERAPLTGQGFESILECLPPKCMKERSVGISGLCPHCPGFRVSPCVRLRVLCASSPRVACSHPVSCLQLSASWLSLACTGLGLPCCPQFDVPTVSPHVSSVTLAPPAIAPSCSLSVMLNLVHVVCVFFFNCVCFIIIITIII